MSRVHDALRRAEQTAVAPQIPAESPVAAAVTTTTAPVMAPSSLGITPELLTRVREVPFNPARDAHIIDLSRPQEAPAEEFRTLRTRLNHLQKQQPIHTVLVTSPSPAEGKSFAAVNLAITEAQLEGNATLLVDCDFRRPVVHSFFQIDRSPGLTDFLQAKAQLHECIRRLEGSNLYLMPAGEGVVNPLELLNRIEVKLLMDQLPRVFNWVLIDSPPLLFAADGNLLSTLCSATVLVVRMGSTTIDSVTRAMQSLCENNVAGIVVNGARRGELYSKYTYYHSYYYAEPDADKQAEETAESAV
jgi:receptor protein-tyrosine kinase